jgi:superfamily II DNA or RNA helicase
MTTKSSRELTLKDRLSRLDFKTVKRLLGDKADRLITRGGAAEIDLDSQVSLTNKRFRLLTGGAKVTISLSDGERKRLLIRCSKCAFTCDHIGAAFSLLLEEKMALGLSAMRPEDAVLGSLSETEVRAWALSEREKRAAEEKMVVRAVSPDEVWTDYLVTNRASGRTYRVAFRGFDTGESFCSCPDFRRNTLGTCKHIIRVGRTVKRRFRAKQWKAPYKREGFSVIVDYGDSVALRLLTPDQMSAGARKIAKPILNRPIEDCQDLLRRVRRLEAMGCNTTIYPDAEDLIQTRLVQERLTRATAEIRRDPANHPLRRTLLNTELLPYQLDGIAFAAQTGRGILADDMGLGKTIQGIGGAELLSREADVKRVLIICPASLKSQWRNEIERFSGRSVQLVLGKSTERAKQYDNDSFYTICNYEQVLRDIIAIERAPWDMIILDEAQRIKNWEAKTSRIIKGLTSRFALVLTGTPLENRLDDLYSIVEFIDDRRLGPAFQFFNRHRVVDEKGKVLGFEGLDELREKLAPIFLRRTRETVMQDLPPRTTSIIRIEATLQQKKLHAGHKQIINTIINKPYLTEMDLLRLQKALLMCRLIANSTFLVDRKGKGYSSKLDRLEEILRSLAEEENRKIVLFSEWTKMLDLIEPILEQTGMGYVRLDGSVPQKKRQVLVNQFQKDPATKVFITTNAGSTGLNLQAANTVINVDLPWNPAVLEQRIGRAHRMGQKSRVQVFLLVTEDTIEENLLTTLSAKHQLALAALDMESDVDEVQIQSGMEELKRRLELLLGAKQDAPSDEVAKDKAEEEVLALAERKERVSQAGGQLLQSAFTFLGELLPERPETDASKQLKAQLKAGLTECIEQDDQGRPKLTVTLPSPAVLETFAEALSRIMPQA